MADKEVVTVSSKEGGLALYGDAQRPSLKHVHATSAQAPLMHMVCWDESKPCKMDVSGKLELTGSEEHPVRVKMSHHFANVHQQTMKVDPLDHHLQVATKLSEPIHHALQMRTPLELRFCNPWHITSNYVFDFKMGRTQVLSITLTGATVCTPQPCRDEKPCPPPIVTQAKVS
jgi:hypothetical protein